VNAVECLAQAHALGDDDQLAINSFVDEFRRASKDLQLSLVEAPIVQSGRLEGLVAAVVSFLSAEAGIVAPAWVRGIRSPSPWFVLPARTFEMRVRLMLESPPPFKNRGVFVPENYLGRA
jgi:hypothetical protein